MAKITTEEADIELRAIGIRLESDRQQMRILDVIDLIRDMDKKIEKMKSCAGCDQCLNLCCPGQEGGK